jgi:macrolide transport system ATP-binding/permease protein
MALGAARGDVVRMVLRETLLVGALGVGIGVPAALVSTRLIRSQLFGLTPSDPASILIAVMVLAGVAAFAGYVPARRAARIDPMVALRNE